MNIGIIIIASTVLFLAVRSLLILRRDKEKPKWVIKAQCLAALIAIGWAILDIVKEIWSASLSDMALSYMRLYGSIMFGLCLGILLTLKLSGQLQNTKDQPQTK